MLVLSASSTFVTVQSYVEYIKKRYWNNTVLYIPHGTIAAKTIPIQSGEEEVILMFGHMRPSKWIDVLFQLFENLSKETAKIKLVIAGNNHPNLSGHLKRNKKIAPQKVDFLGYV